MISRRDYLNALAIVSEYESAVHEDWYLDELAEINAERVCGTADESDVYVVSASVTELEVLYAEWADGEFEPDELVTEWLASLPENEARMIAREWYNH